MRGNKLVVFVLMMSTAALFLGGCHSSKSSSKNCGCGTDINRAYKVPKRHHR